jgi:putative hydrolase of HD superfamily
MSEQDADGLIRFLTAVGRLKRVDRSGWSSRHLPSESVADHSYRTAVLASLIVELVNTKLDGGKVLRMCLIHDLAEAFIGDWDMDATRLVGKETKVDLETCVVEKLFMNLPTRISGDFIALWREFNENSTLEAKVVHLADKLEAVIQAYEMRKAGVTEWAYKEFVEGLGKLDLPSVLTVVLEGFVAVLNK